MVNQRRCFDHYSDKDLIGQRFPGLLVNGSLTDEAYSNFLQFRVESEDLGLRGCNLEEIMNEVLYGYALRDWVKTSGSQMTFVMTETSRN